jgi:hypothetical protein
LRLFFCHRRSARQSWKKGRDGRKGNNLQHNFRTRHYTIRK